MLGNPNLAQRIGDFDRSKISDETMARIESEVFSHPEFTFENAHRASKSAPPFFEWLRAVRDFFYVFREVEPRRDAYMYSEIQLKTKVNEYALKKEEVAKVED